MSLTQGSHKKKASFFWTLSKKGGRGSNQIQKFLGPFVLAFLLSKRGFYVVENHSKTFERVLFKPYTHVFRPKSYLTGVLNRVGGGSWPHLDNIEKSASFLVASLTWSTPWHHRPGWYAALGGTAILPYHQLLEG